MLEVGNFGTNLSFNAPSSLLSFSSNYLSTGKLYVTGPQRSLHALEALHSMSKAGLTIDLAGSLFLPLYLKSQVPVKGRNNKSVKILQLFLDSSISFNFFIFHIQSTTKARLQFS